MALLVRNPGDFPVTIIGLIPAIVVPTDNVAVNITSEFRGLTLSQAQAIEIQRVATGLVYSWTGTTEFDIGGDSHVLLVASGIGNHASTHSTDSIDPLSVSSGASNVAVSVELFIVHETFLFPDAVGTTYGSCGEGMSIGSITRQPSHPTSLQIVLPEINNFNPEGIIAITGVDVNGAVVSELFSTNSTLTTGNKIFSRITDISHSHPFTSNINAALLSASQSIGISYVDGVNGCVVGVSMQVTTISIGGGSTAALHSSVESSSPSNGSFIPYTHKDGNTAYEVWYRVERTHTVVDNEHSHTVSVG